MTRAILTMVVYNVYTLFSRWYHNSTLPLALATATDRTLTLTISGATFSVP